jgi:AcrR family transcriptional regulator
MTPLVADTSFTPKRERILDAAEELFALHGFDAVTLRGIAKKAGVDVALASYHFGKKNELFQATFMRRAQILNDVRMQALLAVEREADGQPKLEEIISAFLRPIQQLQLSDDPGWHHYCALLAYVNNSSVWGEELMHNSYDPLVNRYLAALRKALPAASEERLQWCYHYLSGALTLTLAQTGRIDRLSDGLCHSSDMESGFNYMIPFVVAGFERLCTTQT